jgi:hypothetical protein
MNLRDLPNLTQLDKQVIECVDATPFQLLLDKFGDPSETSVTRVCGALGMAGDYYDRVHVFLSLKSIGKKIAARSKREAERSVKPTTQSQPDTQPA